jgi:Na+-transporting NADH:ubiquinone oxidoreductase subunit NqrA
LIEAISFIRVIIIERSGKNVSEVSLNDMNKSEKQVIDTNLSQGKSVKTFDTMDEILKNFANQMSVSLDKFNILDRGLKKEVFSYLKNNSRILKFV